MFCSCILSKPLLKVIITLNDFHDTYYLELVFYLYALYSGDDCNFWVSNGVWLPWINIGSFKASFGLFCIPTTFHVVLLEGINFELLIVPYRTHLTDTSNSLREETRLNSSWCWWKPMIIDSSNIWLACLFDVFLCNGAARNVTRVTSMRNLKFVHFPLLYFSRETRKLPFE